MQTHVHLRSFRGGTYVHITQFTPVTGVTLEHIPDLQVVASNTCYARCVVAVIWQRTVLSYSAKSIKLPSIEVGKVIGQQLSIAEAVNQVLSDGLGFTAAAKRQGLLGQFSVGSKLPPVYLVGYFPNDAELKATLKRKVAWLNDRTIIGMQSEVPVELLKLVMTMKQGDELGYGDESLVIWTPEHEARAQADCARKERTRQFAIA